MTPSTLKLAVISVLLFPISSLNWATERVGDDGHGDGDGDGEDLLPTVMVVLLARNKAGVLPYTLTLLERLDYPKERMAVYVRSDHNEDGTVAVLRSWLDDVGGGYHFLNISLSDDWPVLDRQRHGPTAWGEDRFRHLMRLKEEALEEARRIWVDRVLFLDADVFLMDPGVLKYLAGETETVLAPLLKSVGRYSNFWAGMSESFYYQRTDQYGPILDRKELECFSVPMVHSCVLVNLRRKESQRLTFLPSRIPDYRGPFDDIITFALSAKTAGVPMYVCNQRLFGYVMLPLSEEDNLSDDTINLVNLKMQVVSDFGPLRVRPVLSGHLLKLPEKDLLGVDQVYLINLKRREDRRAKMDYCFDELGIRYKEVKAVDGREIDPDYLEREGIRMLPVFSEPYHNRPLTYGEIGCFMSHYKIWLDVIERGHETVIVFEDDIRFEPHFRQGLENLRWELDRLAPDWELVFLGRKILKDSDEPWVEGSNLLVEVGYTYWTLAYMLSRRGAEKLVQGSPLSKMVPVDEYLPIMYDRHPNDTWKQYFGPPRDLRALSVHPLLVHPTHYTGEDGYVSDTEDTATIAASAAESGVKEEL